MDFRLILRARVLRYLGFSQAGRNWLAQVRDGWAGAMVCEVY